MSALSLTDITNSIKNARVCFCDSLLKSGFAETFNGRPVCYSGNYGAIFKFKCNDTIKAVRIWTKDLSIMPELPKRSKILSDKIHQLKNSCFVGFEYQEKGLLVSGKWTPIVVMDWCKGENLKDAIEKNLNKPDNIKEIARNFLEMVCSLHKEGISHGDLQHGNILINDKLTIQLIDYDSLYIPCKEFDNKIEEIKGLPDYQHPNRMLNKYANSKVDYFSELIIYLSLVALAENPTLWRKYNIANKDYSLLFNAADYSDIQHAAIYSELKLLSEDVNLLLKVLEKYLSINDINNLEPFDIEVVRFGGSLHKALDESLYCINCGKEFYSKEDLFCINCGVKKV